MKGVASLEMLLVVMFVIVGAILISTNVINMAKYVSNDLHKQTTLEECYMDCGGVSSQFKPQVEGCKCNCNEIVELYTHMKRGEQIKNNTCINNG